LEQGWTPDDWQWFYHASQGGSMELPIPYEWMINLEVPKLPLLLGTDAGRLLDDSYITRFGFLPNPRERYEVEGLSSGWEARHGSTLDQDTHNNPDRLPIGFVRTTAYPDRRYVGADTTEVGQVMPSVIGFTCAACHTGQLNYEGRGIHIDGGSAMVDLGKFREAVGYALVHTLWNPWRWRRFASRVLGSDHADGGRDSLKAELRRLIERGRELKSDYAVRGIYPTEEGFSRLDAVGRIGNFVLGQGISRDNLSVANAPVNFPHLWDTPWFEWVQYNASFKQPMMRNAGEALGVFAAVNLTDVGEPDSLFASTVDVVRLHEMEGLIRGDSVAYTGLRAPEWPEQIFGPIDRSAAGRGEGLYVQNCQGCHLPPTTQAAALLDDSLWVIDMGRRYLRLNVVNLFAIGTDSRAAVNMVARTVGLGALGEAFKDSVSTHGWVGMDPSGMGGEVSFGLALPFVIQEVIEKRYGDLGIPEELRDEFNGLRSPPFIRAPLGYKARPLNGVWATPPYLHNGSVQNIYQLLGPEEERDSVFWLGTKEYDPRLLGYASGRVEGGFEFDTAEPGNSNKGHHFSGGVDSWLEGRRGVIGRALSHEERMDLIEFLKAMPAVPAGSG
jgi:mono/diheme cytochrome c family protein